MKIEEKINESIKDSMKEKNSLRLDSLRAIKSAILIEKTKSGSNDQIEESVILNILQKMVKQRNESAKIYLEQNRKELAEVELSQAKIISEFSINSVKNCFLPTLPVASTKSNFIFPTSQCSPGST